MSKLRRRYTKSEFAILSACIRPYELWSAAERRSWARTCRGFRQFTAPNVTPIEHYVPQTPAPQSGGGARRAFSRR